MTELFDWLSVLVDFHWHLVKATIIQLVVLAIAGLDVNGDPVIVHARLVNGWLVSSSVGSSCQLLQKLIVRALLGSCATIVDILLSSLP